MLFLCNVVLNAQSVCITPPEDITWNCGEEDWLYVYTQTDDVIVHSCDDIDNQLFQPQKNVSLIKQPHMPDKTEKADSFPLYDL